MKRRLLLKTGVGAIAILAGGAALWGSTREPRKALAPWKHAGQTFGDGRIDCLAYAILAPSPHNRQPWLVELVGDNSMKLYCDLDRRLPQTDPYDRQITIGLGCFLELLNIAASGRGYKLDTEIFPHGEPGEQARLDNRPIANIRFSSAEIDSDPLFEDILNRRSAKEAFSLDQQVAPKALTELLTVDSTYGSIDAEKVERLQRIIYEGMAIEFNTAHTLKESADLMRFGKNEIEANPDGIDIGGAVFELLTAGGLLTRENFGNPEHALVKDYLARVKSIFETSQGVIWQTSAENSRAAQLQAGANYVRLNLKATQLGLAIQPVSQSLQEYPEMSRLFQKVHAELDVSHPHRIQMIARIGYTARPGPSPRWSVHSMLSEQLDG